MEFNFSGSITTQLLIAYLAGLGTVLTPCIYPLIPVTVSLFGVTAQLSRFKAFLLSASYVAGICLTYTILGLFAALTGSLFGSFLGNPIVVLVLAVFLILLALFSLDVIQIPLLGKIQSGASKIGGTGYGGVFLAGTVSGFVAAPCAGPILVNILAVAAQSKNTALGALLLFIYALGFGTVFLIIGTFSNLTQKLPRPGNWMGFIKLICAAALFAVTLFIAQPFLPTVFEFTSKYHNPILLGGIIFIGLTIGHFAYKFDNKSLKVLAALVIAISSFQLFVVGPPRAPSDWGTSLEVAVSEGKTSNKIAMIDFFADWCAACKEFEKHTFSDERVKEKLKSFQKARLNFSIVKDPEQAILDKYEIPGLPCILFLNSDGTEVPDSRITEFVPADEFLTHLDNVLKKK